MFGTVRGRIGYDASQWLYYVTGGFAWTSDQFTHTQFTDNPNGVAPAGTIETKIGGRIGWTVGAGIEAPIAPDWTGRLEYLYSAFGNTNVTFQLAAQRFDSNLSLHQVHGGA
jgi:opacity protein-like surface antigen